MPTPSTGIDVAALAAPLVDLGFGLAGTAKVTVLLQIVGGRTINARADTVSEAGGYSVTVPGMLYSRKDQAMGDAKEGTLLLNASDLVAAGVPADVHPKANDKATINGVLWTVFFSKPIPTNVVFELRVRR